MNKYFYPSLQDSRSVRVEKHAFCRQVNGFTLIEIAIVLVIISLVAGAMLGPLSKQISQRKIAETQKLLEQNRDALLGYAVSKGYLPCPAVSATDGNEATRNSSGTCPNNNGYLPWLVLGTPKADSWNRLFRYIVTANFANNNLYKPTLFASGDITVHSSGSTANQIALAIPIILISHGPNGNGAVLENGIMPTYTWGTNSDEQINAANNSHVVSRPLTENTTAPGGEFDDIVVWIPTSILFNRMVAAGQLP
jgi:prepilin-type N-terminal cleavage/methylation domain-containing protein